MILWGAVLARWLTCSGKCTSMSTDDSHKITIKLGVAKFKYRQRGAHEWEHNTAKPKYSWRRLEMISQQNSQSKTLPVIFQPNGSHFGRLDTRSLRKWEIHGIPPFKNCWQWEIFEGFWPSALKGDFVWTDFLWKESAWNCLDLERQFQLASQINDIDVVEK